MSLKSSNVFSGKDRQEPYSAFEDSLQLFFPEKYLNSVQIPSKLYCVSIEIEKLSMQDSQNHLLF